MELEQRVAELERRLTALERQDPGSPRLGDGDFWALDGLKQQLAEVGEAAAESFAALGHPVGCVCSARSSAA